MSLFGTLNTSVQGMNAQANKLGTIGDNIANSSTTGYKDASAEFETLLGVQTPGSYSSGGVSTRVRYAISGQGAIDSGKTNVSNLAINGNGFFVVRSPQGGVAMTRAGDFVPDKSTGELVNTAGYELMGYSLTSGVTPSANGTSDLVPIRLTGLGLSSSPTSTGTFSVNMPSTATAQTTNLPDSNPDPTATPPQTPNFTKEDSLKVYDNLGNVEKLNVYMTKTNTNEWQVSIYNNADANATTGGFPYGNAALATTTIDFSAANGAVTSGGKIALQIPNGQVLNLDMSASTQLAADYGVSATALNGNAPSAFDKFTISKDGVVSTHYTNGASIDSYRIPLATVQSPDNLTPLSGNVYQANPDSGDMLIGVPLTGKLGNIESNSLEESTVDIATELTAMIAAQRSYQANSQVLQTSSDLLGTLNNIHA